MPKCLLLLILFIGVGNAEILQLSEPYFSYEEQMKSDPNAALIQLLAEKPKKDSLMYVQKQLLLSQSYYSLVYPEKALSHAKMGLESVSKEEQTWLYYNLKMAHSMALDIAGKAKQGLADLDDVINYCEQQNNTKFLISALSAKGYLLTSAVEYIQALDALQKAYRLAQNDPFNRAVIAGAIALVYEYRKEDALSIPFFIESADYQRQQKNWLELSIALYGLGRAHIRVNQIDLGTKELQESAALSKKVNDHQGEAYALKELAGLAIAAKQYQKAETMVLRTLDIFRQADNKFMQFDANKILSVIKLKTNDVKKAKEYLNTARSFINEENQPLQSLALDKMNAAILAKEGHGNQAYQLLKLIMAKQARLLNQQSTRQLHQLRADYDLDKKERENQLLEKDIELKNTKISLQQKQNKTLQLLVFITLLLSALLLYLAYKISQTKKYFQKRANFDALTRLNTRSRAIERINEAFTLANQTQQDYCLAMIDLDLFKKINDVYGHVFGDEVLKEIGILIRSNFDKTCICGRFGGEEFIIGLPQHNLNQAHVLLEKLRTATEQLKLTVNQQSIHITLSVGVCSNRGCSDLDDMIKCADDALYVAKNQGRNQVVINPKSLKNDLG